MYCILKYPLRCPPTGTLHWISQQPMMMEACFNLSRTLFLTNESFCNIRVYLHRKQLFYGFWRLQSPITCKWLRDQLVWSRGWLLNLELTVTLHKYMDYSDIMWLILLLSMLSNFTLFFWRNTVQVLEFSSMLRDFTLQQWCENWWMQAWSEISHYSSDVRTDAYRNVQLVHLILDDPHIFCILTVCHATGVAGECVQFNAKYTDPVYTFKNVTTETIQLLLLHL